MACFAGHPAGYAATPLRRPPHLQDRDAIRHLDPGRTKGFWIRQPSPQAIKKAPCRGRFYDWRRGRDYHSATSPNCMH
jgi:hypothetical protein